MLGYWRSVGNSLNDFFYEAFLDELADKGGKRPVSSCACICCATTRA